MNYWLDLFTPYTWTRFRSADSTVAGFSPHLRKTAFGRVQRGDVMLCYLVKLSRWCGILEVVSEAYEDGTPIFSETDDPFSIRFKVSATVVLDFEQAIPIDSSPLWKQLSFTRDIVPGTHGWAQKARLRQSLTEVSAQDAVHIVRALETQALEQCVFPLDDNDRSHLRREFR